MNRKRHWLSEPILVFVLVAAGIFALDALRSDRSDEASELTERATMNGPDLRRIVISDEVVKLLREEFTWLEGREPDADETEMMIDEWLEDEVVFRLSLLQQMHMNDGKMREHMIEKVRLLWAGVESEPSEEQLLAYYAENMAHYYAEPRTSFEHVFFTRPPQEPAAILARLQAGDSVQGEDYWLGQQMQNYAESILKNTFGGDFYQTMIAAPRNEWLGPLESPRGFHFVRVSEHQDASPLAYHDIRQRLRSDWQSMQMRAQITQRTRQAMAEFTVVREVADE